MTEWLKEHSHWICDTNQLENVIEVFLLEGIAKSNFKFVIACPYKF